MNSLPVPFPYVGGKSRMLDILLPLLPCHQRYCEPFGGGAALLLAKEPVPVEIYNDTNEGAVSFFRALIDHQDELLRRIESMPYSRSYFELCRDTWQEQPCLIEKALRWYAFQSQVWGGKPGARQWGRSLACNPAVTFENRKSALRDIRDRLLGIQIEHKDGVELISDLDGKDYFLFVDPPYPGRRYYHDSFDHEALLDTLSGFDGKVLLTVSSNELYDSALGSWHKLSKERRLLVGFNAGHFTEDVYLNYEAPTPSGLW